MIHVHTRLQVHAAVSAQYSCVVACIGAPQTKEEAEGKGDDARAQAPSPVLVVTVLSEAEADTPPAQRDGIEVVQTTGTTSAEISNKVAAAGADAPTAVQHS